MEFKYHNTFPDELENEWDDLVTAGPAQKPFMFYSVVKSWWETRGGGEWPEEAELNIVTAWRDGQLVGIAPFFFVPDHDGRASLLLIGSHEVFDYLDLAARPEDLQEFVSGLLQFLQAQEQFQWKVLDFYNLLDDSPTLKLLEAEAQKLGWQYNLEELQPSPYILLEGDWETYLAGVKKKQRHEIRRKIRRFEELEQPQRWYFLKDRTLLDEEMETFLDMMEQDSGKQNFLTPAMREYMHEIARCYFDAGYLLLAFLELDGQKIAGKMLFNHANRLWAYNSGVNQGFNEHSPGWVLLGYLIQWATENNFEMFDFMRGNEEYKYRFGAVDRFVMRATLTR